jgi:hypothetical protein
MPFVAGHGATRRTPRKRGKQPAPKSPSKKGPKQFTSKNPRKKDRRVAGSSSSEDETPQKKPRK